jgi:serine/threonine-protein kinase
MAGTEGQKIALEACDPARYTEIRGQVERVIASPTFSAAPRSAQLLQYLVERTLAGEGDRVNEYSIGVDVFRKLPSFDPRSDSAVRTDVMRLRQRLRRYYENGGRGDPVVLKLPVRCYRVNFEFRDCAPAETAVAAVGPAVAAASTPARVAWRQRPGVFIAAVVVAAGCLAGVAWRLTSSPKQSIQSVVVLPFQDFSSDHQSGYLADGLTDEITGDLANLKGLRVIARTSAFEFKGKGIDIRQIGRQLNVDASLEGSIDREGDRIRIRAQLNRNSDGSHLWSHVYDVEFHDLIAAQRDIARSIADDLQLSRSPKAESGNGASRYTPTPEAHEAYLRGLEAFNIGSLESLRRAIDLFQNAVAADPRFAQAWAQLAGAHWNADLWGDQTPIDEVRSEVHRALDLDSGMASAHALLGYISWKHDYDWRRAEAEMRLALQYGPGSSSVHNLYGASLLDRGRFAESHSELREAQALSPLETTLYTNEALAYLAEGRLAEAEEIYRRVLAIRPDSAGALAGIANVRVFAKDCDGAGAYSERLARISGGSRFSRNLDFAIQICRGNLSGARQWLEKAPDSSRKLDLAAGYLAIGDTDRALELLRVSASRREVGFTAIRFSPYLTPLRSDPRFIALEREYGLE